MIWTYHISTGGDLAEVPGGGQAVQSATVDGRLWARTRQSKPIGGDRWDYRMEGTDAVLLKALVGADLELMAVLAAFGVTPN